MSCPLLAGADADPWRVVLPRGGQARSFVRGAPAGNPGAGAVVRVEPYRSVTSLTRRQDRALRTAYTLGYFDYPRRGSLGEVARALGIGRSTALEILRRATGKLAGRRYGPEVRTRPVLETHRRSAGFRN